MSKRLESLRAQLAELDEKQTQIRGQILAISDAHENKPIEGDQAVQYRSLNEEFDGIGPQIRAIESEVAQLEKVLNAPERAQERSAPTVLIRQANPLDDENVQYGAEVVAGLRIRAVKHPAAAAKRVARPEGGPDDDIPF